MQTLSHEDVAALDEFNGMFIQALRSSGFQDGEKVNVLVTTTVLPADRERVQRLLAGRGAFVYVQEAASGLFRKRHSFEARSADFSFNEREVLEWTSWSFAAHRNEGVVLSIGVCRAE
jgi:hypothetical protein